MKEKFFFLDNSMEFHSLIYFLLPDFLITAWLYDLDKKLDPGQLTDLRSALVNNCTLGTIVAKNNFHTYMLHQSPALHCAIESFIRSQEDNKWELNQWVR